MKEFVERTKHKFGNGERYVLGVPLKDYPTAPEDQPECEIDYCPECKKPMWVSRKKRSMLTYYRENKVKYKFECWNCLLSEVSEARKKYGEVEFHMHDITNEDI